MDRFCERLRCVPAILVNTLADEVMDNGLTSLREAITQAAANPGADTITFAADLKGEVNLSLGQLTLNDTDEVTIEATKKVTTIDASSAPGCTDPFLSTIGEEHVS